GTEKTEDLAPGHLDAHAFDRVDRAMPGAERLPQVTGHDNAVHALSFAVVLPAGRFFAPIADRHGIPSGKPGHGCAAPIRRPQAPGRGQDAGVGLAVALIADPRRPAEVTWTRAGPARKHRRWSYSRRVSSYRRARPAAPR